MKRYSQLSAMICGLSLALAGAAHPAAGQTRSAQVRSGQARGARPSAIAATRSFGVQRGSMNAGRSGGMSHGSPFRDSARTSNAPRQSISGFNGLTRNNTFPGPRRHSAVTGSGITMSPRTSNTTNGSIAGYYRQGAPRYGGSSGAATGANSQANSAVHHNRNTGYYNRPATSNRPNSYWGARPSNRPGEYRSTTRAGQNYGGRNLGAYGGPSRNDHQADHHDGHHNKNRHSPRLVGRVNGFNVRNGWIKPDRCGTIVGGGLGNYGYNGYRAPYGSYYYGPYGRGGYYYGSYYGGPQYNYGIYTRGYQPTDVNYGYDSEVYEGDVFDDLSTDVISDEAGEEMDYAEQSAADRLRNSLQNRAFEEFGAKQAEDDMRDAGLIEPQEEPSPESSGVMLEPSAAATARQIGVALGRGDKAFESGKYDQARSDYARALALAGEDSGSRLALGLAEFALGSFDDAAREIRAGIGRSPSLAMSDFDLRAAYGRSHDFETHRGILEEFAAKNPRDLNAQFLQGFVRYFSGDRKGGIEILDAYLIAEGHDDAVREFINTARVAEHPLDR